MSTKELYCDLYFLIDKKLNDEGEGRILKCIRKCARWFLPIKSSNITASNPYAYIICKIMESNPNELQELANLKAYCTNQANNVWAWGFAGAIGTLVFKYMFDQGEIILLIAAIILLFILFIFMVAIIDYTMNAYILSIVESVEQDYINGKVQIPNQVKAATNTSNAPQDGQSEEIEINTATKHVQIKSNTRIDSNEVRIIIDSNATSEDMPKEEIIVNTATSYVGIKRNT